MNAANWTKGEPTLRVFLSYEQSDRPYADRLRHLLSQAQGIGHRIFTTDSLSAGEDWSNKLREEIAGSDVFLVLLSPSSARSKWVLQELGAAWALNKPIIPVLTHPELSVKPPVELSDARIVSLESLESPETVRELLEPYEQRILTAHNGQQTAKG